MRQLIESLSNKWRRARDARQFLSQGEGPRFFGVFHSRDDALRAIRSPKAVGYDHEEVTEVNFANMCRVADPDHPVMLWLKRALPTSGGVLDAGGHMGTKYRAFRPFLPELSHKPWTVWDVPAMVEAGARRAAADGLDGLRFTSTLATVGAEHDIWLASGLLQYLDLSFPELLASLPALPRTVILNKVAVTDEPSFFTLENLGFSAVPYHVRNESGFLAPLLQLGYRQLDRWENASLSHRIPHHPEVGPTRNIGLTLELDSSCSP